MKRLLLSLLLLAVVSGCFRGALQSDVRPPLPDYWPTKEWRSSAPEAQGADAALLADAVEFVVKEGIDAHALLIVRHGYVILDAAFYPAAPGAVHDQASTTKSVVSTLVGIAIDKGSITSVRQPVLSLFKDRRVDNLDDDKRAMTVDDVLTMRSGLTCIWSNLAGPMTDLIRSPDWVQYILDRPMVAEPGTRWCYSNSDSHLLSGIVRAATGVPAVDYAKEHLFGPLGITDVVWPADPQGNNIGYAELRIAPRDMAKFRHPDLGLWPFPVVSAGTRYGSTG